MFQFGQNIEPIPRMVQGQTDKTGSHSCIYRMPGCNQSNINTENLSESVKYIIDLAKQLIHKLKGSDTDYNNYIEYICDTTKEKIGKYSPGMHIPIVPMKHFYKNIPDVTFLFAWNHKKEIFKKEKKYLKEIKWMSHVKI